MYYIDLKQSLSQGRATSHLIKHPTKQVIKKLAFQKPMTSHIQRRPFEKIDAIESSHFKVHKNIMQLNMAKKGLDLCSNFVKKIKTCQNHLKSENDEHFQNMENRNNFLNTPPKVYKSKEYFSPTEVIRKHKKEKVYPRYKILELFSLYRSIIEYSKNSPSKLLHAFQSVLTFQKINIQPQVIRKSLFNRKKLEFQDFVAVYKRLEELTFIQSISDYLEIIFGAYSGDKMKFSEVYSILLKRSEHCNAMHVTQTIWRELNKQLESLVSVQEILDLCQKDMEFCSEFGRLYKKQEAE